MANDRDPEANPAAFLGAELRRGRLAAGIKNQDKLARMLGYDRNGAPWNRVAGSPGLCSMPRRPGQIADA